MVLFFLLNMIDEHGQIMFITWHLFFQGSVSGGTGGGTMSRMTPLCSGNIVGADAMVSFDSLVHVHWHGLCIWHLYVLFILIYIDFKDFHRSRRGEYIPDGFVSSLSTNLHNFFDTNSFRLINLFLIFIYVIREKSRMQVKKKEKTR